jgi:hypothetical protein
MKNLILILIVSFSFFTTESKAQDKSVNEKYGKTLNMCAGIGYNGYVGRPIPEGFLNYEFDVARNFTLAPFVGIFSYENSYYWGNPNTGYGDPSYRLYSYRATSVPVGVKGSYYFDQLFHAGSKWDFYAAASVGFVFRHVVWENTYYGDKHVSQGASPLYLDAHVGAEYHMTPKAGVFLDLSTGVSTFGLAIHF